METEQQQRESIDASLSQGTLALEGTDTANLPKLPPASEPESQWQQISRQISQFLEQLPQYLSDFFRDYKQPLISVALILAAIITARVVLTVLAAINDIPLLSPLFELVGISYTSWFVFRYLLKASTRQELADEIQSLKNQFVGE
ncbi:MAG: CAAD domain-containing protein [Nostoc sp. DedQUE08]|uniref:CAAD domain-containing protein n=1 Tax=unclassified Nostoc TaxID=2593658 RepID=UPI002AD1FCCB|nr:MULTISPECIES: CAAD domain-containing protein [unclassified Nostoc]MDZ8035692.1 CAAD domain-containing protein [Nostoc sp. DedSLP04]MDZ8065677.1 CAAD domain-containing protein [Nostoc sp. DedQUE08]MDZ8212340.1 CAAD domain-containing protein [Nostoc sp. ChiSLP03a]